MTREELILLAKKYVEGKASPEERHFLETYYAEFHPGLNIEDILAVEHINTVGKDMFGNIQQRINDLPVKVRRKPTWRTYTAAAASILVMACGVWLVQRNNSGPEFVTAFTKPGGVSKVRLSDGTLVWLNADSKLRFPNSFDGSSSREVYLDGEAYFEVAKDKKHPFLVHSKNLTTRVLGTKFDVKAYQNEKQIEVTLLEGKVMLTASHTQQQNNYPRKADTIFLKPNERAYYAVNTEITKRPLQADITNKNIRADSPDKSKHPSLDAEVSSLSKKTELYAKEAILWRDWGMSYRDEPLDNVIKAMERRYNVEIKYASYLSEQKVSLQGSNKTAEEALLIVSRQLKRSAGTKSSDPQLEVQFKRTGNAFYLE